MDCPKGLKVTKRKDCKAACCALGIPFGIRSEDFKHSRQCYSLDKTCVQERDKNSKAICKIGTHIYIYINITKFALKGVITPILSNRIIITNCSNRNWGRGWGWNRYQKNKRLKLNQNESTACSSRLQHEFVGDSC